MQSGTRGAQFNFIPHLPSLEGGPGKQQLPPSCKASGADSLMREREFHLVLFLESPDLAGPPA